MVTSAPYHATFGGDTRSARLCWRTDAILRAWLSERSYVGPARARARPCWPILSREDDDGFRPEAAGAPARRGAVAEAATNADATVPGSAIAPRAGPQELQDARPRQDWRPAWIETADF